MLEQTIQSSSVRQEEKENNNNIWDEYYPLLQSNAHPLDAFGSSNIYSAQIMSTYKDALLAYVVTLTCMVVLSLSGLVFCHFWGLDSTSGWVSAAHILWLLSPIGASVAMRQIASVQLRECGAAARWQIRPLATLFQCRSISRTLRLLLFSIAIPLICEIVAFTVATSLHVVNPVKLSFIEKIRKVFGKAATTTTTTRATTPSSVMVDGWVLQYIAYTFTVGIFWDVAPPSQYDFGQLFHYPRIVGCSWLLLGIVEEIGWAGSLYPVMEVIFTHSTLLSSSLTGLIWALWHWPFIIAEAYQVIPVGSGYTVVANSISTVSSLVYTLFAFTLTLVGSRIIMCWLQCNNNYKIWTSAVYHAAHKLFVISVFGQLVGPVAGKPHRILYFSGESSLILVAAVWFSACILVRMCTCLKKRSHRSKW